MFFAILLNFCLQLFYPPIRKLQFYFSQFGNMLAKKLQFLLQNNLQLEYFLQKNKFFKYFLCILTEKLPYVIFLTWAIYLNFNTSLFFNYFFVAVSIIHLNAEKLNLINSESNSNYEMQTTNQKHSIFLKHWHYYLLPLLLLLLPFGTIVLAIYFISQHIQQMIEDPIKQNNQFNQISIQLPVWLENYNKIIYSFIKQIAYIVLAILLILLGKLEALAFYLKQQYYHNGLALIKTENELLKMIDIACNNYQLFSLAHFIRRLLYTLLGLHLFKTILF